MKDVVHTAGSTFVGRVVGRRVGPDDGRRVGKPGVGRRVGPGDGRRVVGGRVSGDGSGINNGFGVGLREVGRLDVGFDVGLRVVGPREVGLRVGIIPGVSIGEYVG